VHNRIIPAVSLLVAALVLLLIYGSDVAAAALAGQKQGIFGHGFIPLNDAWRGIIFGMGAVLLSIIGFVVARNQPSNLVSSLLIVNGAVIIAGMVMLAIQPAAASGASSATRTIVSTVVVGLLLIALGIWKVYADRKKANLQKKEI
jgi:hypothetical protein